MYIRLYVRMDEEILDECGYEGRLKKKRDAFFLAERKFFSRE